MTTLCEAAQQALEAMRCGVPTGRITLYAWDKALSDLDAALAQEQAEPVAWLWKIKDVDDGPHTQQLYFFSGDDKPWSNGWTWKPLYTAPPKAEPLTEEEIMQCFNDAVVDYVDVSDAEMVDFARAVERALEEKNRGR